MAQGFFAGGNGTKENPFLIEDADDLNAMRMHLNSYFELINDINLSNGKYNLNQGWQPINNFAGVLDGKNHKIINLYINRPTEDIVGFFKNCHGGVFNLQMVDSTVVGHDVVGVLAGLFQIDIVNQYSQIIEQYSDRCLLNNISVINCKIKGTKYVGGFCGVISHTFRGLLNIKNIFVDAEIQSEEGIAYGLGLHLLDVYPYSHPYNIRNCNYFYGVPVLIDDSINCYFRNWTNGIMFHNCISKLRKNESITTYYVLSKNSASGDFGTYFQNCYADNSEIQPVIYAGITYKNITDIQHEIDLLPNVDSNYFTKKVNAMLEPKFLNNDSIYLQFNDGYHVYDFENNEFVQKYAKFSNENSKEIVQNGMDKSSFSKIPNSKLKEIQDKYGKVKVVNCINAHKRIVYKTNTLEMNRDKAHSVYRKKVEFNNFNEITSIKKK